MGLGVGHANGSVILDTSDDEAGFDPTEAFPGHLGLKSIRERAERLGGTLDIESASGRGTDVRVRISSASSGGQTIWAAGRNRADPGARASKVTAGRKASRKPAVGFLLPAKDAEPALG